jgi:predicted nucleotidyltransferase
MSEFADFCRRWKIVEAGIFGSAVRGELRPDSDIDFLVTFAPDAEWSLLDVAHIENELSDLVGRPVDLIERSGVEKSPNWIRRRSILESVVSVYAAG